MKYLFWGWVLSCAVAIFFLSKVVKFGKWAVNNRPVWLF